MTKSLIIERTLNAINQLPEEKAVEISDFAEFIMKRFDDQRLLEGIQKITSYGETFNFLSEEDDLYTVQDLRELYNEQR